MEDFDIDLTTVRVAAKSDVEPFFGRYRKHVRIVRQQNSHRARCNQPFSSVEVMFAQPLRLVIDAGYIQRRLAKPQRARPRT